MWINQGIVLVGGRGSRLGAATQTIAKPMLEVAGRPFVEHVGIPESLETARRDLAKQRTRPAAFLDRDGVLNVDRGYTYRPDQFEWLSDAPLAIRVLNEAGYYVFVVTNQSGIARGLYTQADVGRFHAHMQERLTAEGAHIDAFYYCPHHPEGKIKELAIRCRCRKPEPGLLEQAASEWPIDRERSFLIGDQDHDLAAAAAFNIRGVKFDPGASSLSALVQRTIGNQSSSRA